MSQRSAIWRQRKTNESALDVDLNKTKVTIVGGNHKDMPELVNYLPHHF